jgi:UDP-N-acetylmuramoyl-tripeptide--D-alanyl-D-alanine ligase
LSYVWIIVIPLIILYLSNHIILSIIIFLILFTQPYLPLGYSLIVLKPYEVIYKKKIIKSTYIKISSFKKLKTIAITGSYGKSSTKEILYQILKDKHKVLRTSESINTVLGISKVVNLELDNSYEYFICEMAAFKKGEISELCSMIPPHYGIITGISKQHLIRFGSINNIVNAKFELLDSIKNVRNIVFNLDNNYIRQELIRRHLKNLIGYGIGKRKVKVKARNIRFNKKGSSFKLVVGNRNYLVKTKLFGYSNVKNILAAISMALTLGITLRYIIDRIKSLKQIPNRSVLNTLNETTYVNNTYSSNPKGFQETIDTAKRLSGKKVLVTPGLVELGVEENEIHLSLGQKSKGVFEKVILVGKTNRTRTFAKGFNNPSKIDFIADSRSEYQNTLNSLLGKSDWVFLENDLTQNY